MYLESRKNQCFDRMSVSLALQYSVVHFEVPVVWIHGLLLVVWAAKGFSFRKGDVKFRSVSGCRTQAFVSATFFFVCVCKGLGQKCVACAVPRCRAVLSDQVIGGTTCLTRPSTACSVLQQINHNPRPHMNESTIMGGKLVRNFLKNNQIETLFPTPPIHVLPAPTRSP